MKIETLKERIQMAEAKLIKLNGTIERHTKQLDKMITKLTAQGINTVNYDKFDRSIITTDNYYDLCDYESKLVNIADNNKKIAEATKTLSTLTEQLNKQLAQDAENNNIIPECLNVFLANWKTKCFEYYTTLANEFIELKFKKFEITKEELELLEVKKYNKNWTDYEYIREYTDEEIQEILSENYSEYNKRSIRMSIHDRHIKHFKASHFASDIVIIEKIIDHDRINDDLLNKILDDDVKIKRDIFISRIKEVIGEIKDLSRLTVDARGEINGIAIGNKCNAKVETIGAGGHNIQCYHYRILVNTVK